MNVCAARIEPRPNLRNLEAKFRLADHSLTHQRALAIGFESRGIVIQRDTFFVAANGKLKLREQAGESWLIHYGRGVQRELQLSNYTIVPVSDPVAMRTMLANSLWASRRSAQASDADDAAQRTSSF